MKIRLTTSRYAGGEYQYDGDEIDLPDSEGQRLIKAGQAEPLVTEKKPVINSTQRRK